MTSKDKSTAIILIEKLRLVESEIFRISSKYGVKSISELDNFIEKGRLSEEIVGDDIFLLDKFVADKAEIEQSLAKLSINKNAVWENLQSLLGLPKLSFQR